MLVWVVRVLWDSPPQYILVFDKRNRVFEIEGAACSSAAPVGEALGCQSAWVLRSLYLANIDCSFSLRKLLFLAPYIIRSKRFPSGVLYFYLRSSFRFQSTDEFVRNLSLRQASDLNWQGSQHGHMFKDSSMLFKVRPCILETPFLFRRCKMLSHFGTDGLPDERDCRVPLLMMMMTSRLLSYLAYRLDDTIYTIDGYIRLMYSVGCYIVPFCGVFCG